MSIIFEALIYLRNKAYDLGILPQESLPGVVYSIGNVAVGGTGKTPVVIALVKQLTLKGCSPVILTRGYGSSLKKSEWIILRAGLVIDGNANPSQLPDEAVLQSIECPGVPVVVGADRLAAALAFLKRLDNEFVPTHWVLDDGFQHRRIQRDIDIVLLDKANPSGKGWLLPYGFLREPLNSVKRATHILFTGHGNVDANVMQKLSVFNPAFQVAEICSRSELLELDVRSETNFSAVNKENVLVVAGIARPERLLCDLKSDGITEPKKLFLRDHQPICAAELLDAAKACSAIVTTSKDYWRNPEVFKELKIPVFVKKIEIILPESLVISLL